MFDKDIYSIYISGSISGRSRGDAEYHFKSVQEKIEQHEDRFVYNPMDFKERSRWEDYMRDGLAALVDADAIVMLDGWQKSRGACLERNVAFELKIPIYYEYQQPWAS
jgi:hypothetical protein